MFKTKGNYNNGAYDIQPRVELRMQFLGWEAQLLAAEIRASVAQKP